MKIIKRTLPENLVDELYRVNFLETSQSTLIKLVADAENFNSELYQQEKSIYSELLLERKLLIDSIMQQYFMDLIEQISGADYKFYLDLSNNMIWFYLREDSDLEVN